jgi:sodium/pantothenate symporter
MPNPSPYTLVAFAVYMVGVFLLGALSHKLLARGSFLKEYFLGDRKLNAWVLGLTYVATSVSAGSFMGFPSLIYTHGWCLALWIAGYMVGGLVSKGVLAKRLNQVSRLTGAITVPDVLRDRFQSPALSVLASLFLLAFLVCNLVGQFKAGGLILQQVFAGATHNAGYERARAGIEQALLATHVWTGPEEGKTNPLYGADYPDYILGVLIFAVTVIAYTTYGGFWAVTWTDVLQGTLIVAGAMLLMILALVKVGGLAEATERLRVDDARLLAPPGPTDEKLPLGFLPMGLAVSFFFLWTFGAMGQPVGMVRMMACRDTPTLRTSLFLIGIYYALIYLPLVVTFICARALYPPEVIGHSDRIMPVMALAVTERVPVVGGLILAAPYSAAMSAVAGFLLLMSSSIVRDLLQRNFLPHVSLRTVKIISYTTTAVVGVLVTCAALRPIQYLQYYIVFSGTGMACTFLAPTVLALYWPRATRLGALAALIGGFVTVVGLYAMGYALESRQVAPTDLKPYYLAGLDPLIYGLGVSFACGIIVSWLTRPPPEPYVARFFVESESSIKSKD